MYTLLNVLLANERQGGFSNIYRRAWYQQSAVATYLKKHSPSYPYYKGVSDKNMGANGGIYNRAGMSTSQFPRYQHNYL